MANTTPQPWEVLRVLRERSGLKAIDVARSAELSKSYYSRLESGVYEPNPSVTFKIARALNVPMSVIEKRRVYADDAA